MEVIKIKRLIKGFSIILSTLSIIIFSLIIYGSSALPDFIKTIRSDLSFSGIYTVSVSETDNNVYEKAPAENTASDSDIKLFGTFPVKKINVTKSERKYLIPGGELVGIRLKTNGVLVVGTESFRSNGNTVTPAEDAGITIGDSLLEINGKAISTNKELAEIIANSSGQAINLIISRNGEIKELTLLPQISDITGNYKGGLWVRDSTGGIGTLTYFDIENGTFASLGHGIYDTDTNKLLPSESGELYSAELNGIQKGVSGCAGELKGVISGNAFGKIKTNCDNGIFGNAYYIDTSSEMMPVAAADEINTGEAQIISTINNEKAYYNIEIEKINLNSENKNMIIKITDEELLSATGGIIQGMSGSPIIQNGRIVGAVTHVFVNDPTRGYGIFIDNMLNNHNN